jgi:hypothetical protein
MSVVLLGLIFCDILLTCQPLQWSKNSDLVLTIAGKVKLTHQTVIIRSVISDSFRVLLGNMLFDNAYPNAFETIDFVQDAVLTAARGIPTAKEVHTRLLLDPEYMTKILPLVCHILESSASRVSNITSLAHASPCSAGKSRPTVTGQWRRYLPLT